MNIDWVSSESLLILNPRLSSSLRQRWEGAWQELVLADRDQRFGGHIGLATSGSSGDSFGRLILLSKSALLVNALAVNAHLNSNRHDIWMKTLPDFHVGGLSIGVRSHLSGAPVVESRLEKWDAVRFYDELVHSRATLLSLVPSQLFDLVRLNLKAPSMLRAVVIGGARLEPALHQQALRLGWPALPSYGMTECGSQVATAPLARTHRLLEWADSGKMRLEPLSHVEVRVGLNDRIEIRSAALLTAQISWEGEKALLVDPKTEDGWLRTEDRGRIEVGGSLTILGRSQDFIKIGGEGVVVSRLEARLEELKLKMGLANDFALLAASDPRLGAIIVLLSDASSESVQSLIEAFNESVMPFEKIRSFHTVTSIPRSSLGKLLRREALALVGLQSLANE